ncbi:MAG: tetratricopeptide repeat protein, partial [Candidatus Thorarchaeota archaeon]
EWKNRSDGFLAMLAKASYLRGMYGFNQVLAKGCDSIACKGYAAAAYCRQSLDPRWLNNLRNYVNQAWQSQDYVTFAQLSGQLAAVLTDLGYADRAREVAEESIEKVTKLTSKNEDIRRTVQAALLRPRIVLAYVAHESESIDEALIRLDSAEDTANHLDQQLALADIEYYRARALYDAFEFERALSLVRASQRKYERMGYLHGVADARNLRGVVYISIGQLQEARDQFEELLVIQQQLNNQIGLAKTLINVGEIDRQLGQIDQMQTYNLRALEISQEAEYMRGIGTAKVNLGDVAVRKGNYDRASEIYDEVIGLASSSGMKDLLGITFFLSGDVNFIAQRYQEAIEKYKEAKKISLESGLPHLAFNADISELLSRWELDEKPKKLRKAVLEMLGDLGEWRAAQDSSLMHQMRQKVHDDPGFQGDICIFHHLDLNFECRVERKTLKKDCYGNLFWMGGLCPFFKEFLDRLES